MNPTLVLNLTQQPLAIIGDIHGEIQALDELLEHLDHNPETKTRRLVFIGDLCDRGPDSVAVIQRVRELIDQGRALAILGNHEINLLANDAKDGSGWFFDSRVAPDTPHYAPFARANASQRPEIRDFFCHLPLAIRMPGLRIVHAAWDAASVEAVAKIPLGSILELIHDADLHIQRLAQENDLEARYLAERERWAKQLEDPDNPPPYLDAVADFESLQQRFNPIKRMTSGIEARSPQPFYSGHRWRYSDRIAWWDQDQDPTPVVIGHYWRLFQTPNHLDAWRYSRLFRDIGPTAWHGAHQQAFCIDYSVGGRWSERRQGKQIDPAHYRLAALLWPENQLVFDNGQCLKTT
ncbi:metallophosphoesterase [Castellaniella sp.]|uniref:metallophosphoesterase n=1 Tax=Castellaniella sp. TaxID=1955812 RepID=UPI002AFF5CBA|nr:metallophosphoesterase [Castellaniella sp.]